MNIEVTGYWTFFCNPAKWQIDKFLSSNVVYDTYQITKWQKDYFKPGQLGVIRVGVDGRNKTQLGEGKKLRQGIYSIVQILSEPYYRTLEPDKYWLEWTEKEYEKPIVNIKIIKNLLNSPIYLEDINNFEDIYKDKYILNGFQASTMPLKKETYDIITTLVDAQGIYNNLDVEIEFDTNEDIKKLETKYSNAVPQVKEIISKKIERGAISQKIKIINNHKCLICESMGLNPCSFIKRDGEHYIETHHIMPVSMLQEGSLNFSNVITICANHHRQLHYGYSEIILNTEDKIIYRIDDQKITINKSIIND